MPETTCYYDGCFLAFIQDYLGASIFPRTLIEDTHFAVEEPKKYRTMNQYFKLLITVIWVLKFTQSDFDKFRALIEKLAYHLNGLLLSWVLSCSFRAFLQLNSFPQDS